jgi:hypothetical protein
MRNEGSYATLGLGKRLYPDFEAAFVINPDKSQTATPSRNRLYPAEPHKSSVLSPRPGNARTQVIEREAS